MDFERATHFTRFNTGRSLCDSGFESGRGWQQPVDPAGPTYESANVFDCCLSTTQLLADLFEEHPSLTDLFENTAEYIEGTWFDAGREFMERLGYTQIARDNTYNGENDLSQEYVWEVWEIDESPDWIWADTARDHPIKGIPNTVVLVYVHTGADVRGGYAKPCIGHSRLAPARPAGLDCVLRNQYKAPSIGAL